ncbi:hypothetical protein Cfor_09203 [Coptotermes formosanus]|uniref:Uncharacterized protein n=1 Tax=Coptotermes formosanus TaxID=36987 RepID=A0A6L2PV53_COPFO|nr:hypothetical protein Cfor_09203 [Coptotermes formosanus]
MVQRLPHDLSKKNTSFQFMFLWVQLIYIATWRRQTKGLLALRNSRCHSIQFTMQTETDGHLLLLDINIYRGNNGSLDHRVYRKLTHTNLCWTVSSHHHPANEHSVLSTLVQRTGVICNQQSSGLT